MTIKLYPYSFKKKKNTNKKKILNKIFKKNLCLNYITFKAQDY